MARVELDIHTQIKDLQKGLNKANKGLKDLKTQSSKTNKAMQKNMNQTSEVANQMKNTFVSVLSVGTAISLAKQIVDVRVEFEKFNAMLKVALGSAEAANTEFTKIQRFAAETPFSVKELTDSFVRLVNQGFKPTTKQMKAMGDLAAAMGKDFVQLSEAIIDAQVGEFERLKEFGIRASKEGDQVSLTFKGVEHQVEFTAEAIREAIIGFGEMEGVMGTMEEVSKTLGGQLSNLGDSVTTLADKLGELGSEEASTGISTLKSLVEIMTSLIELKPDLKEKSGILGFLDKVNTGIKTYIGIAIPGLTKEGRQLVSGFLGEVNEELKEKVEEQAEITETSLKKQEDKTREVLDDIGIAFVEFKDAQINVEKEVARTEQRELDQRNSYFKTFIKERLRFFRLAREQEKEMAEQAAEEEAIRVQGNIEMRESAFDFLMSMNRLALENQLKDAEGNEEEQEAIRRKFSKRQQALAISRTIINGAEAIIKLAADLGALAPPFQIAQALQTLAQIAVIRSQKFEKGGYQVLGGRRHAQGGINIGIGEAEDGEGVAVFSRSAVQKYGEFIPAFVKAMNERRDINAANQYVFNYDDSRQVKNLEEIRKLLSKPEVRYENGYRVEIRNGQRTKIKI